MKIIVPMAGRGSRPQATHPHRTKTLNSYRRKADRSALS